MQFILQSEKEFEDADIFSLRQILKKESFQHSFIQEEISFFDESFTKEKLEKMKEAVPVGSLDFVGKYLNRFHSISNMNPIEVPSPLRRQEFLQRKYAILDKKQLLLKEGYWFVKYASSLKYFSHIGFIDMLQGNMTKMGNNEFLIDGYYVLSEVVKILAEYRVFVLNDKIMGIQFYDGDPLVVLLPEELNLLLKMVSYYQLDSSRPKAYSLDIAIKQDKKSRSLMAIECHPFVSLGLYGFSNSSLPYYYRYGIDWYIQHNIPVTPFSNL